MPSGLGAALTPPRFLRWRGPLACAGEARERLVLRISFALMRLALVLLLYAVARFRANALENLEEGLINSYQPRGEPPKLAALPLPLFGRVTFPSRVLMGLAPVTHAINFPSRPMQVRNMY
jgi:hypothetical protein